MKLNVLIIFLCLSCFSCKTDKDTIDQDLSTELPFDKEKWTTKDGKVYPYRDQMLNDIVYNDTIRDLNKEELLELLGEPDYLKEDHLYYRISESRIGSWTLKAKTMVVKLSGNNSIDWIKIHGS